METLEQLLSPECLPSHKDEAYRLIPLRSLDLNRRCLDLPSLSPPPEQYLQRDSSEDLLIFQQSGSSHAQIIADQDLQQCWINPPDPTLLVKGNADDLLGLPLVLRDDVLARLTEERAQNRLTVVIGAQSQVKRIRILNYFSPESATALIRSTVILAPGASVEVMEEWVGPGLLNGKNPLAVSSSRLIALNESRLRYHWVQNLGRNVEAFARCSLEAHRNAEVEVSQVSLGGMRSQLRAEMLAKDSGARFQLWGAARGDLRQRFDFWLNSRHEGPDSESHSTYYTVMADEAQSLFNGNILIGPSGLRTDASQSNKNMLLSSAAAIHTVPKLEIATDDVKCAHGATVVPVDDEQVYYLQSRGISAHDAQLMIINGFTGPVMQKLPEGGLKTRIDQALHEKHSLEVPHD